MSGATGPQVCVTDNGGHNQQLHQVCVSEVEYSPRTEKQNLLFIKINGFMLQHHWTPRLSIKHF